LRERLAALGLIDPSIAEDVPQTVLAFMRSYIASRSDWKKSCNHKQSVDHLEAFLGRDVPVSKLTKGMADRFHRWMMGKNDNEPGLSPNTAGQHIKRCRQMMRAAMDDRLVETNPFQGIRIDLRSDKSKNRFISAADAVAILDACPDQEWRVLFALARYGGLRCPSEILGLRWSDINWERGRILVRSPKTEKVGKGERMVPLFPELRKELEGLQEVVNPGLEIPLSSYVVPSYRSTDINLRKALLKIGRDAGVAEWPKPFMALRASRRTELERSGRFANHVLNDWFGHTGAVAETFYLQTTEDDFKTANGGNAGGNILAHQGKSESFKTSKKTGSDGVSGVDDALSIHPSGFEPETFGSVDRCSIQLSYGCNARDCSVSTQLLKGFRREATFSLRNRPIRGMEIAVRRLLINRSLWVIILLDRTQSVGRSHPEWPHASIRRVWRNPRIAPPGNSLRKSLAGMHPRMAARRHARRDTRPRNRSASSTRPSANPSWPHAATTTTLPGPTLPGPTLRWATLPGATLPWATLRWATLPCTPGEDVLRGDLRQLWAPCAIRDRKRSVRKPPLAIRTRLATPLLGDVVVIGVEADLQAAAGMREAAADEIGLRVGFRFNSLGILVDALPRGIMRVGGGQGGPIHRGCRSGMRPLDRYSRSMAWFAGRLAERTRTENDRRNDPTCDSKPSDRLRRFEVFHSFQTNCGLENF